MRLQPAFAVPARELAVALGEGLRLAPGEIPKLPLNLALLKGAAVIGVFWGDFVRREPREFAASVQQLARWHAEGRLRPHVSQTLPLERAAEAIKLLASRQAKGKIVLTVGT